MFNILFKDLLKVSRDEDGQTLAFVALIITGLIVFIALAINVGDFIYTKADLQGIADAAALSGASWQARGLNLIEMMNVHIMWLGWHLMMEELEAIYWCTIGIYEIEGCITQTADYFSELSRIQMYNGFLNGVQRDIANIWVPITALIEPLWIGGMFGWGLNDADLTIPLGGFWFLWPQLYIHQNQSTGWFFGNLKTSACQKPNYPDATFVFAACYKNFHEEPLLHRTFRAESYLFNGYLALAQARPCRGDPQLLGDDVWNWWPDTDWEVQLMPITVDNRLLALIPFIGPILGLITDFVILH